MDFNYWARRELDVTWEKLERLQDRFYFVCFAALILVMIVGWMSLVMLAAYTLMRQSIS